MSQLFNFCIIDLGIRKYCFLREGTHTKCQEDHCLKTFYRKPLHVTMDGLLGGEGGGGGELFP